jgi:ATP-dependent RNA helicase RhlE
MTFEETGLRDELLRAIADAGYDAPTPIQERAIPKALEGHDLMCCAQTGTGKTAAFTLPILQGLAGAEKRHLSVVILVPTRELAIQVGQSVCDYAKYLDIVSCTAFGGVPIEPQEMMLRAHVDVLVATPGRLKDHMWRGNVDYRHTRYLVLDEADRMLDMGFIRDVMEIVNEIPKDRQSMLFSATLDRDIERLSRDILREPVRIEVAPPASTLETVDQYLVRTSRDRKRSTLERLIRDHRMKRTIIFARTKSGASTLASHLQRRGFAAIAFHSDRSQSERVRTLESFKNGEYDLLVATDIAARGLDVDDVSHVVNYDMPYSPDSYVHRIGRTARAGRRGMAIMLVTPEDTRALKGIERLIDRRLPYLDDDRTNGGPAEPSRDEARPGRGGRRSRRGRSDSSGERRSASRSERSESRPPEGGDGEARETSRAESRRREGEREGKRPRRRSRGGRKRREARERREAVTVGDGGSRERERPTSASERRSDEKSGGLLAAIERLAKGLFGRR